MILLTKLDGSEFVLNSELIESVDTTPDTMVRLIDKKYFIVQESLQQIIDKVIEFKIKCKDTNFYNNVMEK